MSGSSTPIEKNPRSPGGTTVAVTGGTGFIGGAVIRRLLESRLQVKALLRPQSRAAAFAAPGLSWIQGEMADPMGLCRLLDEADAVVHCAGSVRGRVESDFAAANVAGIGHILQAARQSERCRRFLLISSLAAREPHLSLYAASKRRGELILLEQGEGLQRTIFRPPAVYGPGDRELLPLFQWLRRGILLTPGGAKGRFSLIFVEDLAGAVAHWAATESLDGGCHELHDGKNGGYSWEDVGEIGANLFGRRIFLVPVPEILLKTAGRLNAAAARFGGYRPMLTPGKVRELCHEDWVCDNASFGSATGWRPEISLLEGLRRTLGA